MTAPFRVLRAKAFGWGYLNTIDNSHASDIPQGNGSNRQGDVPRPTSARRQRNLTCWSRQAKLTVVMVEPGDVLTESGSEDPAVGLRAVASLRALVETVEELQVRRARELGWSWQQIAVLLGVSKQAVHQKFGAAERRPRRRRR